MKLSFCKNIAKVINNGNDIKVYEYNVRTVRGWAILDSEPSWKHDTFINRSNIINLKFCHGGKKSCNA
jgi:hypothetical protein